MTVRQRRVTDEMYDSIPSLLEQGISTAGIAELFNVTPNSLKVMCSGRGISLRKGGRRPARPPYIRPNFVAFPLSLSTEVADSLATVAKATGRENSLRLASDLLERIVSDGLYRAVLDEEHA